MGELPGGQPSTSSGATEAAGPQSSGKPFILSAGLPPVPYKLVARILKGEFIDMEELLWDNLEAQRRASVVAQVGAAAASNAKSRREVPDLMSWVQCFGTYIAVVTSQFPHRIKELLAYQTLIVLESDHTEEQCALYSPRGSRLQHRGGWGQSRCWGSRVTPRSQAG